MNYTKAEIYDIGPKNKSRFTLGIAGSKPLFIFGLNPSTADDKKPDYTIRKIMGFAKKNGYDSFIMFNLYPQRATLPEDVDQYINDSLHKQNLLFIKEHFSNNKNLNVLAAWGETILINRIFRKCLKDIIEATSSFKITWCKIGELTMSGHPRHPSRAPYSLSFTPFEIQKYLQQFN